MKPGSSDRCTVKTDKDDVTRRVLRCHLRTGHDGLHQAPSGKRTIRWTILREPSR